MKRTENEQIHETYLKLRELFFAEPFRPFVVRFADGTKVKVGRREWMRLPPDCRKIAVELPGDRTKYGELLHVTDIKLKSTAKAKSRK